MCGWAPHYNLLFSRASELLLLDPSLPSARTLRETTPQPVLLFLDVPRDPTLLQKGLFRKRTHVIGMRVSRYSRKRRGIL